MEERYIIPNERHVPLYRYDSRNDDQNTGFVVYHSRKYLRRQRKLHLKKLAAKKH